MHSPTTDTGGGASPRPYNPKPVVLTEEDWERIFGKPPRLRSPAQIAANMIADEMRAQGQKPRVSTVRIAYLEIYGVDLPKVTAHRACQ